MDPDRVGRVLAAACAELGLDVSRVVTLGGMTGQVFAVDDVVLRVGWPGVLDLESLAAEAGSAVVPVPPVLARSDGPEGSVVVLPLVDALPAAPLEGVDPARARRRGLACGKVQRELAGVQAPVGLRPVDEADGRPAPSGARLLHLDLHPLNILLGADDEVAAVLDWTNAAAGPAEYDRARTASIFELDPAAIRLQGDPAWRAFVDGWRQGAALDAVPPAATAWACRYMLTDLAPRYAEPELAHVHVALERAERAALAR